MITTLVFDAYGTLFDTASPARRAAESGDFPALGPKWQAVSGDWRRKQLEYTWLRTIIGEYAEFAAVTADALDWALDRHDLAEPALRQRLLAHYEELTAFPETPAVLANLAASGYRLLILSNGNPAWLDAMVTAAGLRERFEHLLSVDAVRLYKPAHQVYGLVEATTGQRPQNCLFVSSNGWDIAGAAHFGFFTAWVNRAGDPVDRLPQRPAHIIPDLTHLARLLQ